MNYSSIEVFETRFNEYFHRYRSMKYHRSTLTHARFNVLINEISVVAFPPTMFANTSARLPLTWTNRIQVNGIHARVACRTGARKWRRMPVATSAVFLVRKGRKKFAAINGSVNLHTSTIGGDKWPEVVLHRERDEAADK